MKKFSLIFIVTALLANTAQALHHPSPTAIATAKTIYDKKGTIQKPQPTGEKIQEKITEKEESSATLEKSTSPIKVPSSNKTVATYTVTNNSKRDPDQIAKPINKMATKPKKIQTKIQAKSTKEEASPEEM